MYFGIMIAFLLFGVWMLYVQRDVIRCALRSYKWHVTDGTILDSSDVSFSAPGIDKLGASVVPVKYQETVHVYEYVVGGHTYRSSAYCYGTYIDRAAAAFLIGTKVRVYYDALDPQQAVLKRGLRMSAFIGPAFLCGAAYIAVDLFLRK